MSPGRESLLVHLVQAAVIATTLLIWQLAAPLGWAATDMLPPFSNVLSVLWSEIHENTFRYDVALTTIEIVVAFLVMVPTGLILGFIIGESPRLYTATRPLLQAMMAVPKLMNPLIL